MYRFLQIALLRSYELRRVHDSQNSFREFCRSISTPRLNTLLCFHLVPINVVISHGPQTIPNLGVGFPLRCFQRLSVPNIATGRCTWRYSPQTRGQSNSVLSSCIFNKQKHMFLLMNHFPHFHGAQTISSPFHGMCGEGGGMLPMSTVILYGMIRSLISLSLFQLKSLRGQT